MSDLAIWPPMAARSLRLTLRTVDALLVSLALPVLILVMFVHLFGGAIQTGGDYVVYAVPGVMVLCAAYGASMTAVAVAQDVNDGIVDRFRSMDVGGAALVSGHVTAATARNLASAALVVAVAHPLGFRAHGSAAALLAAAAILIAFIVAMSAVSAVVGMLARSTEAASGFTFGVLFLPYPSSAFVPVETMPGWLRGFAEHQPVTPVIESVRALLLDLPAGNAPWLALAWSGGILATALLAAGPVFRSRTR